MKRFALAIVLIFSSFFVAIKATNLYVVMLVPLVLIILAFCLIIKEEKIK